MRCPLGAWLALCVLGWTAAPWAGAAAAEPTHLSVGVSLDSPFMLPFYLVAGRTAHEEGLEVQVVSLDGGPRVAAALASGSIDVGVISLSTLVNLVLAGQRAKGFYAVKPLIAFNLRGWLESNRHAFEPPAGNKVIWEDVRSRP